MTPPAAARFLTFVAPAFRLARLAVAGRISYVLFLMTKCVALGVETRSTH